MLALGIAAQNQWHAVSNSGKDRFLDGRAQNANGIITTLQRGRKLLVGFTPRAQMRLDGTIKLGGCCGHTPFPTTTTRGLKIKMKSESSVTAKRLMEILQKQNFICPISGRALTPETASLDHIIPLSRGGEHSLSNVWIVDQQINHAKGTLLLDEFVALCRSIVAHQSADSSVHFSPN